MQMMASASKTGFYESTRQDLPDDAVEISDELYQELLNGPMVGKVIVWTGKDGLPYLADPPPPTDEELVVTERYWRDAQLLLTDPVVSRHRDEVEEGGNLTLTAAQYSELQAYRRKLRDWPTGAEFPASEHRPKEPVAITNLV